MITRATGTAALHDNARLLEQNGLAVARFRTNREEMSVSISGNDNYTPGITTFNTLYSLGPAAVTLVTVILGK